MDSKASKLNRWTLTEGGAKYLTVMSFGHLRKIKTFLTFIVVHFTIKLTVGSKFKFLQQHGIGLVN